MFNTLTSAAVKAFDCSIAVPTHRLPHSSIFNHKKPFSTRAEKNRVAEDPTSQSDSGNAVRSGSWYWLTRGRTVCGTLWVPQKFLFKKSAPASENQIGTQTLTDHTLKSGAKRWKAPPARPPHLYEWPFLVVSSSIDSRADVTLSKCASAKPAAPPRPPLPPDQIEKAGGSLHC